jgi:RimJ/RimL family protein N-acetyltransferase
VSLDLVPARLADLDERPAAVRAAFEKLNLEDGALVAGVLDTLTAVERALPWGAYWAVAADRAVGLCGFKAGPDAGGAVEIAYFTFPGEEGRGLATVMARALAGIAAAAGAGSVIAHTLPERGASCVVLERNGFVYTGPAEDPEDGPVWAWRLVLHEAG